VTAHARLSVRSYPTSRAIAHVVKTAKKLGIDVAGVEVSPDGTIRAVEARALPQAPASLFDELEQAGKL
jgi:hypothetical protein